MSEKEQLIISETIQYYNEHSSSFIQSTIHADMSDIQTKFIKYLKDGASILDFGCGTGRDSKMFLEHGYQVTALDGSEEMCKQTERLINKPAICTNFLEYMPNIEYDAIWACASLLHLPSEQLEEVMKRLYKALKMDGTFYASFKYGEYEGIRKGRYFTDMTEQRFEEILQRFGEFYVKEYYITSDVRPGRENEKWLNVYLGKK